MKMNKLFTIDVELIEKLKAEDNQSKIINDLLKNYYADNLSIDELKKEKINQESIIKKHKSKLEYIEKELKEHEKNPTKGLVVRSY